MKIPVLALLLLSASAYGQSLSSLNFNYWYDPNAEVELTIAPVKTSGKMLVYYQLTTNRKESPPESYSIDWESRQTLTEKSGKPILAKDSIISKSQNSIIGVLAFASESKLWHITAKITNTSNEHIFYFYKPMDPSWPVNNVISAGDNFGLKSFLPIGSTILLNVPSHNIRFGFLYKKDFSGAMPPYAEIGRTDPFLKADSVFLVTNSFQPKSVGLYLIQEDTTTAQGITFRVTEKNYPKYTQLATLFAPLIYITTDDEFKQLASVNADKAAFDKVILEITRDKERAKNLMRSYFQRVESANRYFTEYKEGWKTDRGMIYIIYGKPDEVSKSANSETWYYQTRRNKFVFQKTGSIFAPENYKLQRQDDYKMEWFSLIDLWRKSRF